MYVVRDIFQLKFGHYKDAKLLLDEALKKGLMPSETGSRRVLSDFTGDAYRLVFEQGFNSLTEYEKILTEGMNEAEWQQWYGKFKNHVKSSYREILKLIM